MNELSVLERLGFVPATDKEGLRNQIATLETRIKELPQLEIRETHHFSKGVYAREIFIPKGTLLVGKIHRHENLNICSQGDASVLSTDGAARVKAPCTLVSQPGAKRVIYAHEDTVWTTIHGTDLRDLTEIENEFIAKDYGSIEISEQELQALKEAKCLG
jgi:hypothetical protein